ncbi:MAG: hypothetical protein R3B45_00735 [Bdellovibrionota bacterium]
MNFLKSKSYFFLFAIVVIVGGLTAYFRLNYINPASQGPSNSLGTIESLIGKAKIHPNNKTNWTDLHVYQKLHNKDKIVTLSKERASFKISGKHLFELEEKTSIQLGEQKKP